MNVSSSGETTEFRMSGVPVIGYAINDNWEAGAGVLLGGSVEDGELSYNTFQWAISPYARYYFFNRNNWRIGVHGEASVGGIVPVGTGSSSMAVTWGLNFMPVVTYSPKEHWVVIASCGFLGVGLNGVEKSCSFGLNVMNGGANQIGLGFAYVF